MQSAVCHTRLLNKQQGPGNFVREVNGSQHLMDSLEEKSNPTGHLFLQDCPAMFVDTSGYPVILMVGYLVILFT